MAFLGFTFVVFFFQVFPLAGGRKGICWFRKVFYCCCCCGFVTTFPLFWFLNPVGISRRRTRGVFYSVFYMSYCSRSFADNRALRVTQSERDIVLYVGQLS